MSPLSTYLRTRRFNRPTFGLTRHTNLWKNTAFRDFSNIWRGRIFFLLTFWLLHLLSTDLITLLLLFNSPYCRKFLFKLPSIILIKYKIYQRSPISWISCDDRLHPEAKPIHNGRGRSNPVVFSWYVMVLNQSTLGIYPISKELAIITMTYHDIPRLRLYNHVVIQELGDNKIMQVTTSGWDDPMAPSLQDQLMLRDARVDSAQVGRVGLVGWWWRLFYCSFLELEKRCVLENIWIIDIRDINDWYQWYRWLYCIITCNYITIVYLHKVEIVLIWSFLDFLVIINWSASISPIVIVIRYIHNYLSNPKKVGYSPGN